MHADEDSELLEVQHLEKTTVCDMIIEQLRDQRVVLVNQETLDIPVSRRNNRLQDKSTTMKGGCKSRDVHEWQEPEEESQQANPQDRPPQYFSENLPHTEIEPALLEDFSPRQLKPYQLAYTPGGNPSPPY
ncbi:Uncharacterized protein Fot_43044 [Forsythia ovata]|uniref:Uncharacterized protein n=1 Tax=Forsythia ovata TaxID=205694 RepID=A0ABD1RMX5_9LAMI